MANNKRVNLQRFYCETGKNIVVGIWQSTDWPSEADIDDNFSDNQKQNTFQFWKSVQVLRRKHFRKIPIRTYMYGEINFGPLGSWYINLGMEKQKKIVKPWRALGHLPLISAALIIPNTWLVCKLAGFRS